MATFLVSSRAMEKGFSVKKYAIQNAKILSYKHKLLILVNVIKLLKLLLPILLKYKDLIFFRLQRDKEDLVLDSGRASDQLISISRQLADTVQRSALAVEELAESSRVVNETNEEFKAMGAVLGHSRYIYFQLKLSPQNLRSYWL